MQLIVKKICKEVPSKFDEGYLNTQILLKSIDEKDKNTYKLNLSTRHRARLIYWMPSIVEGNILDVQMMGIKPLNVDPFKDFKVIKHVKAKETQV